MKEELSNSKMAVSAAGGPGEMKALLFTAERNVEVRDRPIPTIRPGHCLIRVAYIGICGADGAFYKGNSFYLGQGHKSYPFVFGHEWSGTIVALAEDVVEFTNGDRVVGHNFAVCGECAMCRAGRSTLCSNHEEIGILGSNYDGAAAEYYLAPSHTLVRIPQGLSLLEASLIEPATTVVHAIDRVRVRPDDTVAVMGTGYLGLSAIQIIKSMGAVVHSVGIEPAGLKLARDLGADRVLGPDELTQDSYSVVLEFSGSADAARLSPLVVAPGGRIGFVGIVPALVDNFPVSPLVTKDVEVHGVLSGLAYWNKSLDLAAKGSLRPIQLLDRVFPYSEAPAAFEYLIRTDRSKPKLAISFEEQNTPADPD